MAASSKSVALGSPAPSFELPDGEGRIVSLRESAGSAATLVIFICNHCPYVLHMREALQRYALDYADRGVRVVAINPNDPVSYPQETAQRVAEVARTLSFPYLVDPEQRVARAYDAQCTPEPYLFDGALRLAYHGQFDGTRPGGAAADGRDLRDATDRLLTGRPPRPDAMPAIGCSIKWRAP